MTTFDDREKAFENRFAHDQEMLFRAEARRNHAIGLWAAGLLRLTGDDAERYAGEVLVAATLGDGSETVVRRLVEDLNGVKPPVSEHSIRHRMDIALAEARERLRSE